MDDQPGYVAALEHAESIEEVGKVVRTAARGLVGSQGATFVLRDIDKCFYADEDAIAPLWKGQRFPLTACISGWAMLNGEPAVIPDIELDERIPIEAYRPTFVRSLAMVPVNPNKAYAAIGVYWDANHQATEDEVGSIQSLAAATAKAIERISLDDAPWAPTMD